jgi:hypothetical protein
MRHLLARNAFEIKVEINQLNIKGCSFLVQLPENGANEPVSGTELRSPQ